MLYFAFTGNVAPQRLAESAPGAEFTFVAHLPEWRLVFAHEHPEWGGGLPSAEPDPGNTVWGVVFEVSKADLSSLDEAEAGEGREQAKVEIMDRNGRRHEVVTHLYPGVVNGEVRPSAEYLKMMLEGSRHWQLPAGWIAGLEEHLERA